MEMSSATRRRHFMGCVDALNHNSVREFGGAIIDSREAWEAFKGLLGRSGLDEMTEGIRRVYGNADIRRELADQEDDRASILRRHARKEMHIIKRRENVHRRDPALPQIVIQQPLPPVPVPAVRLPPPIVPVPVPAVRLPLPIAPPPGAPPIRAEVANIIAEVNAIRDQIHARQIARAAPQAQPQIPAFEIFRQEIERNGRLDLPFPDDMPPTQIEQLFAMMREWGECPICLENVAKRHGWTCVCDHKTCASCMEFFVMNALMTKVFPVLCPGGCGNAIDPRKVLDVCSKTHNGVLNVQESIVRFNSMQLGSTISVVPSTSSEVHTCPNCRTIVFGRVSSTLPLARCTNPFCAYQFCTDCKIPWHHGVACMDRAKDDVASTDNIQTNSKPCPRCGRRTSHFRNHRCHHMTCLCGYEYCYECLEPWTDHGVGKRQERCPLFCNDTCHCVLCDECKPGKRCDLCHNGCPRCIV